jgi:hypothetical protein
MMVCKHTDKSACRKANKQAGRQADVQVSRLAYWLADRPDFTGKFPPQRCSGKMPEAEIVVWTFLLCDVSDDRFCTAELVLPGIRLGESSGGRNALPSDPSVAQSPKPSGRTELF